MLEVIKKKIMSEVFKKKIMSEVAHDNWKG
jgi:hypothetical protein